MPAFYLGASLQIIGIDYSINGPAIAILGDTFESSTFYFATTKKKYAVSVKNIHGHLLSEDYQNNIERYERTADWAVSCIRKHFDCTFNPVIVMEGYALGSNTGLVCNIAENGGLLKYKLFKEFAITPEIVAPTSLKKLWTGKGNSKKDQMVQSLLDREGVDILKIMCQAKADSPIRTVTSYPGLKV